MSKKTEVLEARINVLERRMLDAEMDIKALEKDSHPPTKVPVDDVVARLEAVEKDLTGLRLSVGARRIREECEAGKYDWVGVCSLNEAELVGRQKFIDQMIRDIRMGVLDGFDSKALIAWLEVVR